MLRTHNCGELDKKSVDKSVTLAGWVHSRRDHGGVIFIDLRDRYGMTQIVFNPDCKFFKEAEKLRREFCIQAKGKVSARKQGMENPNMKTGEIEVIIEELEILNAAEVPPIEVDDRIIANDDVRMRFRYLDLRRPIMQNNFLTRHKAAKATRDYFNKNDFMEIETPYMVKSTPEGARDYVVPSRVNPGKIYALPQSPQLYKQTLMIAGFDRYYQLARAFRDEDLRSDRQPEHTQIDFEMSYVTSEDIFKFVEGLMQHIFKEVLDVKVKTPFPKLTYKEAMNKYGSDKPDTRFGLELVDVADIVKNSDFSVFKSVLENGGQVKCINAKGCAKFSRKDIDELTKFVAIYKAKGLAWIKVTDQGLESSIVKFFSEEIQSQLSKATDAENGDLLLFVADKPKVVATALGELRNELARRLNLADPNDFKFCWITDYPLFAWNEDEERWEPEHHMFSMPQEKYWDTMEKDPASVIADLFDLTLNGVEMASGSMRIHKPELQRKIMNIIGMSDEEAQEKFGFLLEAYKYGGPPHGGMGMGFDRIVAMMLGYTDIREVITFPKNKNAECLMDGAPSIFEEAQLKELHLKLADEVKAKQEKEAKK